VVNVDWFDALLFCCWLTRKLAAQLPPDHRILLPTEAQWERAARGTDARKYPWGDDAPTPAHAVFGDAPLAAVEGRPAGASPVGCHDMAGNVWEWCLTAYTADLQGLQQNADAAPSGVSEHEWGLVTNETLLSDKPSSSVEPACAVARVLRGGSWIYVPRFLRCAFRDGDQPSGQDLLVGFRVCCA
jgi:formylglycine-generating enzyme required for sulfatase activity